MTSVSVDRIEGEFAVLTDGTSRVDVPLAWLPPGVQEGWALRLDFQRDLDAEAALRASIRARIAELSADVVGGDFSL